MQGPLIRANQRPFFAPLMRLPPRHAARFPSGGAASGPFVGSSLVSNFVFRSGIMG
jgi:hypothetical protein